MTPCREGLAVLVPRLNCITGDR